MKKKEKSKQSNSVLNEVHDSIIQKYIATDKENIHYNVSVTDTSMIVDSECALESCESTQLSKCQTSPKAISPLCVSYTETLDSTTKAERLLEDINNRPSTLMEDEVTLCSNWQTPTKIIHNPRFVNEIRTPHLGTPRKARKALQLAKWTITQQKRKIKTLQQARNRLVARVTTMKGLIKHLKQKNLLSEAAAEHLQVIKTNVWNFVFCILNCM